jgi:hypothetical protein
MPSGRDSFRRNRVAPFATPIFYHFARATTRELPAASLKPITSSLSLALEMGYFWAQEYAQAVDSKPATFQNHETGHFGQSAR